MKKILLLIFLFFGFNIHSFANIEIHTQAENIKETISVENGVVIIDADVVIWDYHRLEYPLKVLWDLEIKTHVKLMENIEVTWNVTIWNYSQSYAKITAKNITTQTSFRWDRLEAENIVLGGNNTIVGGFYTSNNFEAGSNLFSKGKSFVWGDFKASMWSEMQGTLVVLGNARGHFDFIFQGDKLVVRGNFRTLEDSKLSGRIYMFADEWHKYKYGNKLWKHKYQFSKLIYKDFFWAVDPFLQYDLSDETLVSVRKTIQKYDYQLKSLQEQYYNNLEEISQYEADNIVQAAEKLLEDKFAYISTFVGNNAWQETQLKILQFQQEKSLTEVFAQLAR